MSEYISNRETAAETGQAAGMRLSIGALARSGAIASVIKLASAGLSFLMLVAVAMVTDERQFGLYSAAYAGASLVSFFSLVGQHSTVLRFWPQYAGNDDLDSANGLMARAILVALAGLAAFSLIIVAVGFLPLAGRDVPEWRSLCAATTVLAFALGWSEFTSCAFRAKNALIAGLLPRDIIWRAVTIAAFAAAGFMHVEMSAVAATFLTAGLLLLSVLPQTIVLLRDTIRAKRGPLTEGQKAEFRTVTLGVWGVTALPPALGQASTLLVAAILGPEAAGAIFVADRTMRLVVLTLNGINQALAPQISNAFYSGDRPHVQRITSLAALGGFAIALLALLLFVMFGSLILSIFDPAYGTPTMHVTLIILGIGATIGTGCGPTEILLQLTGLQHALFKLLVAVNTLGLGATAALTYLLGPIGAALSIAGTIAAWCVIAVFIARREIGINPSIFGFFTGQDALAARAFLRDRA
ncbi:lipopolysaccharide biosynthesis protein [Xaviernesmea oryzae]|uniref:Membrane protein involved in the export of O-antigen and teichoic acid n=1 Tax=Xaviernesmea oryzae TaxID=464029 RepID=A0A1X7EW17_9HYPH|nr:lipopolysaccharide biosynthesis protein [Xaviernesmea oryzae]SMF41349.1 Membrane protein involved in the export of O-antigen and teichoic acid [Xaviernesmea oryzae]